MKNEVLKYKTLLFDVPHSRISYDIQAFENGKFKAYLIVHNGAVNLKEYIDDIKMLPPNIRSLVESFVKQTQVELTRDRGSVELKKAA